MVVFLFGGLIVWVACGLVCAAFIRLLGYVYVAACLLRWLLTIVDAFGFVCL